MFNFTINQLNSPFDDAAFFLRDIYRKRACLFDCGRLGGLSHSDLLSIGDIFVTHTHMDHFVGFDRIIRGALNSPDCMRAYGPPGFINNVDGKFRGYTWNLTEGYTFSVDVTEIHPDGANKRALFWAENRFIPEEMPAEEGLSLDIGEGFTLKTEFFDHRTLSMGFRLEEPIQHSIEKDKLKALGYKEGPWLAALKKVAAVGDRLTELEAATAEGSIVKTAGELADELISIKKPHIITYITDIAPTPENVEKAKAFAKDSTLLVIEAVFLDEDREHAEQKNHLTLGLSKEIFRESGAEYVRFTHFAARYAQEKERFMAELYKGMDGRVHTKNTRD